MEAGRKFFLSEQHRIEDGILNTIEDALLSPTTNKWEEFAKKHQVLYTERRAIYSPQVRLLLLGDSEDINRSITIRVNQQNSKYYFIVSVAAWKYDFDANGKTIIKERIEEGIDSTNLYTKGISEIDNAINQAYDHLSKWTEKDLSQTVDNFA